MQIFMKKNGYENTTHQNIWDAFRTESRGKFIALKPFISNNERMMINDVNSQKARKTITNRMQRKDEEGKSKNERRK